MLDNVNGSDMTEIIATHAWTLYPRDYHPTDSESEAVWMIVNYKEKVSGKTFAAKGINIPAIKGLDFKLKGSWETDKKYGRTFAVSSYEVELPNNKSGVVAYLRSLKCGIGKTKAENLFDNFGNSLWGILDSDPYRLTEVSGISTKIVNKLIEKLENTRLERELIRIFDGTVEFTPKSLATLRSKFGEELLEVIKTTPYKLCSVRGFGFRAIDNFGRKQGISPSDPDRIMACTDFVLDAAASRGHSCLPKDELIEKVRRVLTEGYAPDAVSINQIKQVLTKARQDEVIALSAHMVYSYGRFAQEKELAENIARLLNNSGDGLEGLENIIKDFEEETGMELAKNQIRAVTNAFSKKVNIITGGPGTGKTTIIKAVLYVHKRIYGKGSNPLLLSPTGRAARRMSEATGYPAQTIHSAVGYKGDDEEAYCDGPDDESSKLDANLIIVDESSMMDLFIASELMKMVPDEASIIFVGDPDQLPSVGCGNVLFEMMRSKKVQTSKLDVIFRQAEENPIVSNSAKIRTGDTNLTYTNSFKLFEEQNEKAILKRACFMYYLSAKAYGIDNVILLNPYRNKSGLNVDEFNRQLQHLINPPKDGVASMKRDSKVTFYVGDRVMQMKNTDDAMNGDVGYIKRIEEVPDDDAPSRTALVAYVEFNGDGIEHVYDATAIKDLDLAYCTTIHKSQGSEYQTVIMVVSKQHKAMLRRNLVYTGITRAKQNVAIITEEGGSAISEAILNATADIRYSLLADRIFNLVQI